jgi:hypothetical protein
MPLVNLQEASINILRYSSNNLRIMDENRIKWLIKQKEKETIEFKEFEKLVNRTESVKKDLAKLFAAFANRKGGMVLFGVTDDRKLEGYNLTEEKFKEFEQSLIQIADTKCRPPIYLENIRKEIVDGNDILLVEVPKRNSMPHNVDGAFYIRTGSHNLPITDSTKIKELFDEKNEMEDEEITKQLEQEEIELVDISSLNILIGNYGVPYFKIRSKYSLDCLIFSDAEGFSSTYYNKTITDPITIEELENILKIFYSTFGRRSLMGLHEPSFLINQVCNETKVSYSWFGYGPKNFIQALNEQAKRYSETEFKSPHHNEAAGYVDINNSDDFIFYVGVQPSVIKEYRKKIILEHVEIGFVFESMPFDNRRFINFFEKANLKVPDYIRYEDSYLNFKREDLRETNYNLKNEGLIVYKSEFDQEHFVSKAICKNPFYGIKNINKYLSEHEKIIINLPGGHHPLAEKKKYSLIDFKSIPIPYGGFQFVLLNIRGNW